MEAGAVKKRYYIAGVWDLFHVGHLRAIKTARLLISDDTLIVGVVTDESVLKYKGLSPIIRFEQRYEIISALKYPDVVIRQSQQFCIGHMRHLGIDTVFLGEDWAAKMPDKLREMSQHVEIIYLPRTEGISTKAIKEGICQLSK